MNNITHFEQLIKQIAEHDIIKTTKDIYLANSELLDKYNKLEKINEDLVKKNEDLAKELKTCTDDNKNLNKVSYVRSLSTELTSKNKYIAQLEAQLDKLKVKEKIVNESTKDTIVEENKPYVFNIDNYVDIKGYDLLKYKKIYYLINDKNEIFSILDNKPNIIVGSFKDNKIILFKDNKIILF